MMKRVPMTRCIQPKLAAGALAALLALTTAGCASTPEAPPEAIHDTNFAVVKSVSSHPPAVDAAVVRGSADYDYEPFASITSAAAQAEVGVVGEVVSWSDGRTLIDGDEFDYSAVLKVRVVDTVTSGVPAGGFAYVEVRRGGEVFVDGKPFRHEGARAAYRTVAELSTAVPAGSRVIVLGLAAPSADTLEKESATGEVVNASAGLPEGASLVSPYPQGLLFETASGGFASGYADGEADWGWVPDDMPSGKEFAALAQQLTERG